MNCTEDREQALTQRPHGDDFTKRPRAHFVVRQDAELVQGGGRQARHLQPAAGEDGHRHREPVLLPILLLHPAAARRRRERGRGNKRGEGSSLTVLSWNMTGNRVSLIIHTHHRRPNFVSEKH